MNRPRFVQFEHIEPTMLLRFLCSVLANSPESFLRLWGISDCFEKLVVKLAQEMVDQDARREVDQNHTGKSWWARSRWSESWESEESWRSESKCGAEEPQSGQEAASWEDQFSRRSWSSWQRRLDIGDSHIDMENASQQDTDCQDWCQADKECPKLSSGAADMAGIATALKDAEASFKLLALAAQVSRGSVSRISDMLEQQMCSSSLCHRADRTPEYSDWRV